MIHVDVVFSLNCFTISVPLGLLISSTYQDIQDVKSDPLRDNVTLSHDSKDAQLLGDSKSTLGLNASTIKG
jgi:hypothetical protein